MKEEELLASSHLKVNLTGVSALLTASWLAVGVNGQRPKLAAH